MVTKYGYLDHLATKRIQLTHRLLCGLFLKWPNITRKVLLLIVTVNYFVLIWYIGTHSSNISGTNNNVYTLKWSYDVNSKYHMSSQCLNHTDYWLDCCVRVYVWLGYIWPFTGTDGRFLITYKERYRGQQVLVNIPNIYRQYVICWIARTVETLFAVNIYTFFD